MTDTDTTDTLKGFLKMISRATTEMFDRTRP